ncbi:transglycosylase domain-containing protein [Pseudaestuariivita rosea]|uniref:transglycosylase domain-containing protein n=1 Tax=Pseudaestuariivita rosea TaxID=2763263 RepID=UPI001ABA6D2E|nr:transglycosylase domain-containing protein [Pseudaestuariivita rosea]
MTTRLLPLLLLLTLTSLTARAEGAENIPTAAQLRASYDKLSADWPPVPQNILNAFTATEDRNFHSHTPQFSVITIHLGYMQLPRATNKMVWNGYASVIAGEFTKDEILNWYINTVFLGQGCYGVHDAAQAYFGKSVDDLGLAETAYLAAIPKAPTMLNPTRHYDRALQRRNFVLRKMASAGFIKPEDAEAAQAMDLAVQSPIELCHSK